ncbi:MAG TPA: hypothetical protein VKU01_24570 [Bryobacteraceae bacterium]|nr:hypothetical protein [Bryobacteraceae bacterium]
MRYIALITILPALWASADKKLPIEHDSNELVEVSATLLDKEQIVKELGNDLGGYYWVVRVKVRPLTEKPVRIDYDDFFILNTNDGQRPAASAPSEIAGSATLTVTQQGVRKGGTFGSPSGPIWGGGPGSTGAPQRLPGSGGSAGSNGDVTVPENSVKEEVNNKENPLLQVLKEKTLPTKETDDTVSGLLFFLLDGKIKIKDLELHYKSPAGRLAMRFNVGK